MVKATSASAACPPRIVPSDLPSSFKGIVGATANRGCCPQGCIPTCGIVPSIVVLGTTELQHGSIHLACGEMESFCFILLSENADERHGWRPTDGLWDAFYHVQGRFDKVEQLLEVVAHRAPALRYVGPACLDTTAPARRGGGSDRDDEGRHKDRQHLAGRWSVRG